MLPQISFSEVFWGLVFNLDVPSKGANINSMSMGYDPYDNYDLVNIDQSGLIKTWFGSKDESVDLIRIAYAFILTYEGYPCVFWQDYYTWGLGQADSKSDIAALPRTHEYHAGGSTSILHVSDELYILQRNGHNSQRGLIFVLNNSGD